MYQNTMYIMFSSNNFFYDFIFRSWCGTCNTDNYSCACKVYDHFVEVFRGRAKNFNVTKLQSSTTYRFRLIAENELGRSRASEIVMFQVCTFFLIPYLCCRGNFHFRKIFEFGAQK